MSIDSRGGLGYIVTRWYIFVPPGGTLLLRRLQDINHFDKDYVVYVQIVLKRGQDSE